MSQPPNPDPSHANQSIASPAVQSAAPSVAIECTINGQAHRGAAEPRMLLSDYLRHQLGLTGTHVGCEHGVCGACTIELDGQPVRSCLLFAVQADGCKLRTVEGLAGSDGTLHPVQEAFREAHGLQCGFCTPGILMTVVPFLEHTPAPTREQIRELLGGNLCRCTGYVKIVEAVEKAAQALAPKP